MTKRVLLRDGKKVNAHVSLNPEEVLIYKEKDGTIIHALTSNASEKKFLRLIQSTTQTTQRQEVCL